MVHIISRFPFFAQRLTLGILHYPSLLHIKDGYSFAVISLDDAKTCAELFYLPSPVGK